MSLGDNILYAAKLYWRSIFIILYPLCLLPIFLVDDTSSNRCIYVIVLMIGYWLTEALPIPITCLIPVPFFPLMGILGSTDTTSCYMTEYVILMICAVMIALAMEMSNLDRRISLYILKKIGFSPRKLHIIFTFFTMFVSMWIPDTATTALVIPIVFIILKELEEQGFSRIFEEGRTKETDEEGPDEIRRQPTKPTMGYFISIAFASSIGNVGYLTGNASNIFFKDFYEKKYSDVYINSGYWLLFCVPFMLLTMILTFIIIEVLYMGLFRPKSAAAEQFKPDIDVSAAKDNVAEKLQELGVITFHEIVVAILLILAILLWLFRQPKLFKGWADLWAPYNTVVKGSTSGVLILVILFLLPRTTKCCYTFSSDVEKKPDRHSNGLLTWKYSLRKTPWSLIFVVGASYAIAEGSISSGLIERISIDLEGLNSSPFGFLAISTIVAMLMTQFAPNAVTCGIILPILSNIAKENSLHSLYLMWPATIACNMAFVLEVSTPPNALIANYINLPVLELLKIGIVIMIVSYLMILLIFGAFLPFLIDIDQYPSEA